MGAHTGNLWTSVGTLLASVPFTGETASGWQEENLTTPVAISAFDGTTASEYVVSVNSAGELGWDNSLSIGSRTANDLTAPYNGYLGLNNGAVNTVSAGSFPSSAAGGG